MCNYCLMNYGEDCGIPGMDCCSDSSYLSPEEADLIVNPPAFVSESEYNSMSKKAVEVEVEKDADKNGIITKQSEVYVWNDQIFASYKSALAASKKSKIIEAAIKYMYPNYTSTQVASTAKNWAANPTGYYIYVSHLVPIVSELLAE